MDYLDDDDDDDERVEFEQHEALLFLEIARARSDVRKLEQKLAQAKCNEINTTGKLYKLQADEANRRMDAAETKVGVIRNSIRMKGGSLVDMSIQKRRRIATDDSIQICGMSQCTIRCNGTDCSLFRSAFWLTGGVTLFSYSSLLFTSLNLCDYVCNRIIFVVVYLDDVRGSQAYTPRCPSTDLYLLPLTHRPAQ